LTEITVAQGVHRFGLKGKHLICIISNSFLTVAVPISFLLVSISKSMLILITGEWVDFIRKFSIVNTLQKRIFVGGIEKKGVIPSG